MCGAQERTGYPEGGAEDSAEIATRRPPDQARDAGVCRLRDGVYHAAQRAVFQRRSFGVVSSALANRAGVQANEVARQSWSSTETRGAECPGVALRETAGGAAGTKADAAWSHYFPLGVPA